MQASQLPVYILAGGQSSRFGSDKARAIVNGQCVMAGLVSSLKEETESVWVVADRCDRYADLGFDSIVDRRAAAGPLAGLETALQHHDALAGRGWILVTNCDLVRWSPAWPKMLIAAISEQVDAVVFDDELPQPFPGLYHTCLTPIVESQLDRRQFSLRQLFLACRSRIGLVPIESDRPLEWTFNDREKLEDIVRTWNQREPINFE